MTYPHDFFFDYKIFKGTLSNIIIDDQIVISTINQYSFCVAELDNEFKKALQESDILLPDGVGVVWSNYFLNHKLIKKIAGADLHSFLLTKMNEEFSKCFYLGSSEEVLNKIKQNLSLNYPNIKFEAYSPPYKNEFTIEDTQEMVNRINSFNPDYLFVGMTAPKQEKWVYKNRKLLKTKVICSIGAVFDFYAGTIKRPSKVWINFGMEWFARFLNEPNRMWKRYFYYGPIFIQKVLMKKLKYTILS